MVNVPLIGEVNTYLVIGAVALVVIVLVFLFSGSGKRTAGPPPRPIYEIGFLFLVAILAVNVVGELLKGFGIDALSNVKFGPSLLAFTVVLGLIFALRLITGGFSLNDPKSVALFITTLVLIIAAIVLIPKVLPEYFSIQAVQLQSMVGDTVQSMIAP